MGNQKSRILELKRNNNTNTEGNQGLMSVNSDKNSKKNETEMVYKEKIRNKNLYLKKDSINYLLSDNKKLNQNNINSLPTDNNEIIKQNKVTIVNNNNSDCTNKTIKENNNSFEGNEKEYKILQNNISIINNLNKYFPKNITKEEIIEIVNNILSEYINNESPNMPHGKQITKKQADLIAQIIYNNIINKNYDNFDYSLLDQINLKIGINDLNKNNIEKLLFKGKKINRIQNDIIMKNLSKGRKNIKVLFIEIL
jgi:hypothetical protein